MKKYVLICMLLLFIGNNAFAQKLLTDERIDSIWSYNADLGNTLRILNYYNEICTSLGIVDTIQIKETEKDFIYLLGGKEVNGFRSGHCIDDLFKMTYSIETHFPFLHVNVKPTRDRHFSLTVTQNPEYKCRNYAVLENYSNGVLDGKYIEKCLNGKVYLEGIYTQVDSVYQDTLTYFDYDTYEETIEIVKRTKTPIKCGPWFFGEGGNQVKHYLPCPDQ